MGYGKVVVGIEEERIRLRLQVLMAFAEWLAGGLAHWSDFFSSAEEARRAAGKLWHRKGILPGMTRILANVRFDPDHRQIWTYRHLARHLIVDMAARNRDCSGRV